MKSAISSNNELNFKIAQQVGNKNWFVPDYAGDDSQIAPELSRLDERQRIAFCCHLSDIVGSDKFAQMTATPLQKAQALTKTLDTWPHLK